MSFTEGQKVSATITTADKKELTNQSGIVLSVEPNGQYKVFVMGLVMLLPETALKERT